jgi:hypothetical protein
MKHSEFTPRFVEVMPEMLEDGVLYVSMIYALATHKCACGCGEEVVTPFSPTDWQLAFDGERVSLQPSIGNWNFACRSHYWIKGNRVRWSVGMSQLQIEDGRARDRNSKAAYYGRERSTLSDEPVLEHVAARAAETTPIQESLWGRMRKRWARRSERSAL